MNSCSVPGLADLWFAGLSVRAAGLDLFKSLAASGEFSHDGFDGGSSDKRIGVLAPGGEKVANGVPLNAISSESVGAILEIVEDVFVDQAFQMPPTENDHMVDQIPAAGAYPAFRNAVLPWTSEARALGLNAETLHCFNHFIIELWAAIKDQVGGGRVIGKRLAQLLNDPCTRSDGSSLDTEEYAAGHGR
jgi:hypothetical protein